MMEENNPVKKVWDMALQDPHLVRLGDYLCNLEGREYVNMFQHDAGHKEAMERSFMSEPWKVGVTIVKVVDPSFHSRPFVLMWNNKSRDHASCPISNLVDEKSSPKSEDDVTYRKVPGLSEGKGKPELPNCRSWEEWERKGRDMAELQKLFNWKITKPALENREDQKKVKEKNMKTSKSKQDTTDHHCKEKINKKIIRLLMSSYSYKQKSKNKNKNSHSSNCKTAQASKPSSTSSTQDWKGPRRTVSEIPQKKKIKSSCCKKNRKEKNKSHNMPAETVETVVPLVADKTRMKNKGNNQQKEGKDKVTIGYYQDYPVIS